MTSPTDTVPQVTLNDGVEIPQLGFGVFQVPPDETTEAVTRALLAGYRHIDTAAAYQNEAAVGQAIKASGLDRDDVYVTTKCFNDHHGYEQARNAVHENVFDCAVLDVNLSGTLSFSIAEMLKNRGIPFVFCTAFADGVDAYPDALRTSWVDKPVQSEELREAVLAALKAGKLAAAGK